MTPIATQGRTGTPALFAALRAQLLVVWLALAAPHSVVVVAR